MEALMQTPDVARPPRKPDEPDRTVVVGFRLPSSLVDDLDAEAREIAPPGLQFTRTDALKVLLTEAIAARRAARKRGK